MAASPQEEQYGRRQAMWQQVYDPMGSMVLSTALAAIPVVVMLVGLGFLHMKAHFAALAGLVAAIAIAIVAFGMPAGMAGRAARPGARDRPPCRRVRQAGGHGRPCGLAGRPHRPAADRLDRVEHHLPAPADRA